MGKFDDSFEKTINELLAAPALPAIAKAAGATGGKTAISRGLVALGSGLAALINAKNDTQSETKEKKKVSSTKSDVIATDNKPLASAKEPIVQSKFNECYKNIVQQLIPEAGPLLLAAPWVLPAVGLAGAGAVGLSQPQIQKSLGAAFSAGLKSAGDAASNIIGSLVSDPQKTPIAGLTTSKAPLPTATTTPVTTPVTTSTVTTPTVGAPTSTVTPADTDTIATGTAAPPVDATIPIAGAAAATGAVAATKAATRAIPKTTTSRKVGGGLPDITSTGDRALPGVKEPIIGDKFYI